MERRIEQFLFNTNLNYLQNFDFCILSVSKDVLKIYYTYILYKMYNVWNKVVIRINYIIKINIITEILVLHLSTTYTYIKTHTNLNFSE